MGCFAGIASRLICIDVLHAFLLGVVNKWCAHVVWCLILADIWGRTETLMDAKLASAAHALKAELFFLVCSAAQQIPR